MCSFLNQVLLPGDELENLKESEKTSKILLGPGLYRKASVVTVTKPGILRHKEPNVYWIDSQHKRYVPARGEGVIGIVAGKAGDIFRVDVGGSELAALSYLAFEGATKRNRPDVKVGDVVHAKFVVANKDMEPELVCIDQHGKHSGLGVLRGDTAFMVSCSLNLARRILSPECVLLKALGKSIPFEVVVGLNGRVWMKARTMRETIAVANAVVSAEHMTNDQIKTMCRTLVDSLAGFSAEDMGT